MRDSEAVLSVRLEADLLAALDEAARRRALAEHRRVPRRELVREALERALAITPPVAA